MGMLAHMFMLFYHTSTMDMALLSSQQMPRMPGFLWSTPNPIQQSYNLRLSCQPPNPRVVKHDF